MAKIQDIETGAEVHAPPPPSDDSDTPPSTFNYEKAVEYAILIEDEKEKADAIQEAANKKAAPHNEKIANYYKAAAENDVVRKVLAYVLKQRSNARKEIASFAKLSEEHQSQAVQLRFDLDQATQEEEAA